MKRKNRFIFAMLYWVILVGVCTQAILGAAPDAAPETPAWQELCAAPQQPDNYYYTILNVSEEELAQAPAAPERIYLLNQKRQARFDQLNDDASIPEADKLLYRRELQKAHQLYSDPSLANVYRVTGHNIYADIEGKGLLPYFQNVPNDIHMLRKIAELNNGLLSNESLEQAFSAIQRTPTDVPRDETVYNALNPTAQRIYDALGGVLYAQLAQADIDALNQKLTAEPERSFSDIIKDYIRLLQCKFAATSASSTDTAGQGAAAQDAGKKPATRTMITGKAAENIDKANAKLDSALRSLKNAKRYIKTLSKEEKNDVKEIVKRTLSDNEMGIKALANRIKSASAAISRKHLDRFPPLEKFVRLVDAIEKEAKDL